MTSLSWHVYVRSEYNPVPLRLQQEICLQFTSGSTTRIERNYTSLEKVVVSNMGACAPDSPSLLPEAPVASTPGPRATALQKVFAAALSASLKTNSYGNFSSCFPTPASYCSGALEGVWSQVNSRLEQQCNREFEQILVDRQVVAGLNAWEDLIDEARKRSQRAVDGEVPERS